MPELTPQTKKLISAFALWKNELKPKEGLATIHVDEVALKVSAFYEQIRTIIDWKEEHLMRRAAIIRKLKRRFLDMELNSYNPAGMAEPLVLEFIRGGYFPNDKLAESKIADVQTIIEKYIFLLRHNPQNKAGRAGLQFYTQILEIAACEIEETLSPSMKEMALIDYMFANIKERIKVGDQFFKQNLITPESVDLQIYIAVQQALFKLDEPIISYNILHYKFENWNHISQDELLKISQNIHKILQNIDREMNHPLAKKFYAICEKYDTPYLLIGDILTRENPEKISLDIYEPAVFEGYIKAAYAKRLKDIKEKITRAAVYATASIFITKILALVIFEWVLATLFNLDFNAIFLALNILIPTGLMALLVATVRPPSKKNVNLVVIEAMKIIYQKENPETYTIRPSRSKTRITRLVLSAIYLGAACISFGGIWWIFAALHFPPPSIIINIIFIALILFAGTAVRTRSRELSVEDEPQSFFGFFSDVFVLPIATLGKWLSSTWKQYNAITAFFNALIDMPFSAFVEFLERWRYFIKDRKEELR